MPSGRVSPHSKSVLLNMLCFFIITLYYDRMILFLHSVIHRGYNYYIYIVKKIYQGGFRVRRGCMDQIFAVRQVIEKVIEKEGGVCSICRSGESL